MLLYLKCSTAGYSNVALILKIFALLDYILERNMANSEITQTAAQMFKCSADDTECPKETYMRSECL
jgi:hypothetical protein